MDTHPHRTYPWGGLIIGLLLVAVVAAYLLATASNRSDSPSTPVSSTESSPEPDRSVTGTNQSHSSTDISITTNGTTVDVDIDIESTSLEGVGEFVDYEGVATRSYVDTIFVHGVNAALPPLSGSQFYEGWLVMGDRFVSTGKLRQQDDEFILDYTSSTDLRPYPKVVITRESINDQQPETHVLEGTFQIEGT